MTRVIAEIGCNHMGDLDIARKMVTVAARTCGAAYVKFQKRNNRELFSAEAFDRPHPEPRHAFGPSYGLHRERLEFTVDEHRALADHARAEGIGYTTSVWDLGSARAMAPVAPDFLKVPSASNLNWAMQDWLCGHYGGALHVSLGMTSDDEADGIVRFYEDRGRSGDLVLYACTSGYPVRFDEVCLLEIGRLQERYRGRIREVGFSGHHLGIAVDMAAVTLGAQWIERHFTLDRTWKGTDHAASLEPEGLRKLVRDVDAVARALTLKPAQGLEVEAEQRAKLKWVDPADRAA